MISFLLNNERLELKDFQADLTVLNYLREVRGLTGSKEGCASGDCGACTVVLAELNQDQSGLHYRSINSCITFMSALAGKQLITVDHLAQSNGQSQPQLHPVQQAMVAHHGSQCGFCTPGFVMSLFALYQNKGDHNKQQLNKEPVSRQDVITALSGNLCRCTGYRPIIDAALDACNQEVADQFSAAEQETIAQLKALASEQNIGTESLIMPHSREQLAQAVNQYPEARLVAGSTDLALESTQQLKPLPVLIDLSQVDILRRVEQQPDKLTIGAACPLADIHGVLIQHFPQLDEVIERFASLPIRNQAILGVNVANASPIGDMPPVLLALNATINLDDGSRLRHLPIKDFFTGYRQTQLAKGEWIDSIDIPLPEQHSQHLRAYKISKRIEDDISAVCAVFNLVLDEDRVISLSSGFGGVAATPASSPALAHAVVGMQWDSHECIEIGKTILSRAFQPIDDARASANYRREVLAKLWQRFWLETSGQSIPTRTLAYA